MKKHGVGVIGFGVWGCHSLERELVATGRAEIRALAFGDVFGENCYGPDLGRKACEFANESGAVIVNDWKTILDMPDIDVISAMSCPLVKPEIIADALKAGKNVVTDKPLGLNAAAVEPILDAERGSTGKGFMLAGYQARPGVAKLRVATRDNVFGHIKSISIRLNFMGGVYPGFMPSQRWRGEIPSGEMTTIGSHAIITALKMIGSPVAQVFAVMKNDFYGEYSAIGAEDYATLNLRFASGVIANLSIGRIPYRIPGEDINIEITGEKGYARLNGSELESWPGGTKESLPPNPAQQSKDVFNGFLDAVEGHEQVPVSFAEGLHLQSVLDAAIESARSGHSVNVK